MLFQGARGATRRGASCTSERTHRVWGRNAKPSARSPKVWYHSARMQGRGKGMFKILVATDGSPSAMEALEFASALCHRIEDCEITVIHVLDSMMLANVMAPPTGTVMPDASGLFRDLEETSAQLLEEARRRLEGQGGRVVTRTEMGTPAKVICDVAEKEGFRLVVMGHHGTGRFAHMLLGSVVDKVAHACMVPVVVVRSRRLH